MIKVKNWSSYQSYKDRKPPWIRFHKSMLDNYEFHMMSVQARALLPMLWLLASEDSDPTSGLIRDNYKKISFRLRMSEEILETAINECIENDFLEIVEKQSLNPPVSEELRARNQSVNEELRARNQSVNEELRARKDEAKTQLQIANKIVTTDPDPEKETYRKDLQVGEKINISNNMESSEPEKGSFFKNNIIRSGSDLWDVMEHLSLKGLTDAQETARFLNRDFDKLVKIFNFWIIQKVTKEIEDGGNGSKSKPQNADEAFNAWILSYTKNEWKR